MDKKWNNDRLFQYSTYLHPSYDNNQALVKFKKLIIKKINYNLTLAKLCRIPVQFDNMLKQKNGVKFTPFNHLQLKKSVTVFPNPLEFLPLSPMYLMCRNNAKKKGL